MPPRSTPTGPRNPSRSASVVPVGGTAVPPPDNHVLLKRSVKRDKNNVIVAVLQFPPFAQALTGIFASAWQLPLSTADRARFLGTLNLVLYFVTFPGSLPDFSIFQHFADQADFPRIAEQRGFSETLSSLLQVLDRAAAEDSPDVKALFFFVDAIISIEAARRKEEEAKVGFLFPSASSFLLFR